MDKSASLNAGRFSPVQAPTSLLWNIKLNYPASGQLYPNQTYTLIFSDQLTQLHLHLDLRYCHFYLSHSTENLYGLLIASIRAAFYIT